MSHFKTTILGIGGHHAFNSHLSKKQLTNVFIRIPPARSNHEQNLFCLLCSFDVHENDKLTKGKLHTQTQQLYYKLQTSTRQWLAYHLKCSTPFLICLKSSSLMIGRPSRNWLFPAPHSSELFARPSLAVKSSTA